MRCLKYWLKIIVMPEHRLVKQNYNMLKHFDTIGQTNWVSNFRRMLSLNGFGYIWERQFVTNKTLLIRQFHQRLKDQYLQEWHSQVQESSKLYFYKLFKSSYCLDNCISVLNIRKFRYFYMSLKVSSLDLEIQTGSFNNTPREERLCKLCKNGIEDEYHLLLKCPIYIMLNYEFNICLENMLLIRMYINLYCLCLLIMRKLYVILKHSFIQHVSNVNLCCLYRKC